MTQRQPDEHRPGQDLHLPLGKPDERQSSLFLFNRSANINAAICLISHSL
jgi:hypothetical protein